MSDSTEYQASEDEAFGRRAGEFAGAGQGAQGTYARQAPFSQPMYAQPMYVLNPVIEKIRSNASTARMFSYLRFPPSSFSLAPRSSWRCLPPGCRRIPERPAARRHASARMIRDLGSDAVRSNP